jgi:hypothetical protein
MRETRGENAKESELQVGQETYCGRRQFQKLFKIASPTDITRCLQRTQLCVGTCDCVGLLVMK